MDAEVASGDGVLARDAESRGGVGQPVWGGCEEMRAAEGDRVVGGLEWLGWHGDMIRPWK